MGPPFLHTGFAQDRAHFLHTGLHGATLWVCKENSAGNTAVCQLPPSSAHTAAEPFLPLILPGGALARGHSQAGCPWPSKGLRHTRWHQEQQ